VYQFLTGLDPSYESFRAQVLLSTETPSFNTIIAILQREETRRKTMSQNPTNLSENNSIFLAKTNINTYSQNPTNPSTYRQNPTKSHKSNTYLKMNGQNPLTCTNCKKNGHNRDGCWWLHPHLRPAKWKNGGGGFGGGAKTEPCANLGFAVEREAISEEEAKGFMTRTRSEEGVSAGHLGRSGAAGMGSAKGYLGREQVNELGTLISRINEIWKGQSSKCNSVQNIFTYSTSQKLNGNDNIWVIDSGATNHMTNNIKYLDSFNSCTNDQKISVADGSKINIRGKGTIMIFGQPITNLLYVPELTVN
jgi:hypothetical protein